jgi:hypothetical protein
MNLYSLALFVHIVGALGFFIALGLEWFNLQQVQRSRTVEEVTAWFAATGRWRGLAGISMLLILAAGFYMTFMVWRAADWIAVAFGAILVQGAIAGILTTPRVRAIQKALVGASGPLSPTVEALLHHPLLWVSLLTRVGIALGIVFLMSVKPALIGSLVAMGVSIVVGLALAVILNSTRRQPALA